MKDRDVAYASGIGCIRRVEPAWMLLVPDGTVSIEETNAKRFSISGSELVHPLNAGGYSISHAVQRVEHDQDLMEAVRKMLTLLETKLDQP